jgi:hypothetical protein
MTTPVLGLALALAAAALPVRASDAPPDPEYQVRAALLLQVAKFVEWPESAFPTPETPLTIGVVGKDPFGPILDRTFQGEMVKGRTVAIRRFADREHVEPCHILYIGDSETDVLASILERLAEPAFRENGPLTVGDLDGFARRGGMVRFTRQENRIRLHINVDATGRARLKISSKLLKLATIETDEEKPGRQDRP